MRAAFLALLLAGCVEVPPGGVIPDPGPGYPPKMGDVTGQLGGQAVAWETYDFSVGAFDASAWVEHSGGPYKLHLAGYTPGQPQSEVDRLQVTGTFAGKPAAGALQAVEVAIGDASPWSQAQGATLVVERIDAPSGSGYGTAAGRVTASFCPANPAIMAPCRLFEARFTTKVQFND